MGEFNRQNENREKLLFQFLERHPLARVEYLRRQILEYNRYYEADKLLEAVQHDWGKDFSHFSAVDYGCGVGDYGITFARAGAFPVFIDFPVECEFVKFRIEQEDKQLGFLTLPVTEHGEIYKVPEGACNLVIFGEILEHLDEPAKVLREYANAKTNYIFTSSYPYRSDDPNDSYWKKGGHSSKAREQMPACREILEKEYKKIANFGGELNLYKRL